MLCMFGHLRNSSSGLSAMISLFRAFNLLPKVQCCVRSSAHTRTDQRASHQDRAPCPALPSGAREYKTLQPSLCSLPPPPSNINPQSPPPGPPLPAP
eukprot:1176223-Prorocentrum_minimum.AAC.12